MQNCIPSTTEMQVNIQLTHDAPRIDLHPQEFSLRQAHDLLPNDHVINDDDEEDEFSFVCVNPDGSPIAADDIFQNGQIRPIFPLFNRDLLFSNADGAFDAKSETSTALRPPLRKLFVEERDQAASSSSAPDEPEGPFCAWKAKAVEASPEVCKKSNSTGFSKLWRFREFVVRSNSDGKDAFVFFNRNTNPPSPPNHNKPSTTTTTETTTTNGKTTGTYKKVEIKAVEKKKVAVEKKGKRGGETTSSGHEMHYMNNRTGKEGDKRKSYLPYRQDVVGFFANVNGLSKNVHPF